MTTNSVAAVIIGAGCIPASPFKAASSIAIIASLLSCVPLLRLLLGCCWVVAQLTIHDARHLPEWKDDKLRGERVDIISNLMGSSIIVSHTALESLMVRHNNAA